jgi:hypothetical protein
MTNPFNIFCNKGVLLMKKLSFLLISIVLTSVLLSASSFAGTPSAKFAATYTETASLSVTATVTCDGTDNEVCTDNASDSGHTLATIKVPQGKELLVGLSAEIGLMTFGAVKGKNGGSATAIADAEAAVSIHACPVDSDGVITGDCTLAKPGPVKLSKRVQELSAKLGGVIKDCADITDEGTFDVSEDCTVTDEEIALMLSTTASHHFNFVLPNMDTGVYDIVALFTTAASADVVLCAYVSNPSYTTQECDADGTVAATASASSVINKSMLTVQTVRAAKGGIIDADIID